MTPYDKIRAALEIADRKTDVFDAAKAALAELERAAQTPAQVAEIREPTPEECRRIHAFWLSAGGCIGRTPGERIGRAMFDAVSAVMWPKEGL